MATGGRRRSWLSVDALAACLTAAAAAPSIHNTQPWRFEVRGAVIDVLADLDRRLSVVDPDGRQLLMSVGAAVLNLRVAMLAHGRLPTARLLPDSRRPDVVARLVQGPPVAPDHTVRTLAAAITKRRTNRLPFQSAAIPTPILSDLVDAASAEGARLTVLGPAARNAVFGLTMMAEERLRERSSYRDELAAWLGGPPGRRDGLPRWALGPRDRDGRLPLRDFALAAPDLDLGSAAFERHPRVVVLATRGDTPYHWIRAGQALERVLLTATARGLSATPMNQALEVPRLRRFVADEYNGWHAQAILRIGYGGAVPPTPRRGLDELLVPAVVAAAR